MDKLKVGLIAVDGGYFPNLALMKLSAFCKREGAVVDWYNPWTFYDQVYISKVFTYTEDYPYRGNSAYIAYGGYGYNTEVLDKDVEHIYPDYSIYNEDKAYGFLTRGCCYNCDWCIVPQKEGGLRRNTDIEEFWNGQKVAILMDNNVLAHPHGLEQIEKIAKLGIKVDFNQGLDARYINKPIAELLSKLKWYKPLRMACDTKASMKYIEKAVKLLRHYNVTPSNYFVYVLVKDIDDAHDRVKFIKSLGCDPFAQPLRDGNKPITKLQSHFARWVNHKAIFNSVTFEKYMNG